MLSDVTLRPRNESEDAVQSAAAPLLSVNDLHIAFSGVEAVRGISFEIAPGETLGLVGESGSGKSATSLALLRLLPASAVVSGEIGLRRPDGAMEDLLQLSGEAMRQHRGRSLAMIFQEPMSALNPVMKVGDQIAEAWLAHAPRTSQREVRERVVKAMREVALPDPERRMQDYPHQFSGGQRQRIVIAMALMHKPRLLIADEPTTALDVTVQAQIVALLKQLKAEYHLSMLFISHDLAVVSQVADRVAVMRFGEIVEQGSTLQVLTRPQHPYTQALLASAPTMTTPRDRPLAILADAPIGSARQQLR